jgi:hypothetical protein
VPALTANRIALWRAEFYITLFGDTGRRCELLIFAVRPEGAYHQWRKDPSRELSMALVADERFSRVTGWIEAS